MNDVWVDMADNDLGWARIGLVQGLRTLRDLGQIRWHDGHIQAQPEVRELFRYALEEAGQQQPHDDEPDDGEWDEAERIGRQTGHVLARCPSCANRCLVPILNSSGTSHGTKSAPWPRCRMCFDPRARVEPVGDLALVRRLRPGKPRTDKQLAEDGLSRGGQT